MATIGGMEIQRVVILGQIPTIKRALTSKDDDLLSHFDEINKKNTLADFNSTPFKQMLIDNLTEAANKSKNKGHPPLEHKF